MSLPELLFAGLYVAALVLKNNPDLAADLAADAVHLRRRLAAKTAAWKGGPRLHVDTVLRDLASANGQLARLWPGRRRRVLSLAWQRRGGFFRGGDCVVDVELRATRRSRLRSPDGAAERFEEVAPLRRCTLRQFYSVLLPALHQAALEPAVDPAASSYSEQAAEEAVCALCFDAPQDTVAPCAHAFCAACYERWRALKATCPLCRAALPGERDGAGSWLLAEAEAGAEAAVDAAWLGRWLDGLPLAQA